MPKHSEEDLKKGRSVGRAIIVAKILLIGGQRSLKGRKGSPTGARGKNPMEIHHIKKDSHNGSNRDLGSSIGLQG